MAVKINVSHEGSTIRNTLENCKSCLSAAELSDADKKRTMLRSKWMLFGNDEYDSMLFYFADCITYVCLIWRGKSQKKSLFKVPEKIAGSKDGKFMVLLFCNTISMFAWKNIRCNRTRFLYINCLDPAALNLVAKCERFLFRLQWLCRIWITISQTVPLDYTRKWVNVRTA